MRVTVLGSGTVDPVPARASSGFLLQTVGPPIVIDLGAGTLRNGMMSGQSMASVQTVVLTHHHPDHTSDLVPFLFARKYASQGWKPNPPLTIYGPAGTQQFLHHIFAAWPSIRPDDGLDVVEIAPGEAATALPEGPSLACFEAVHGDMAALSLRFEHEGKVVAFSGDTALCQGVIEAARQADLFLCECSCFARGEEPLYCRQVHLSWEDVAEICQAANPARLVLTHLYQPVLDRRPNPLDNLSQTLSLPVELAGDLESYQA